MKKFFVYILLTILMTISTASVVFAAEIETHLPQMDNINTNESLQLMFAKLQLAQTESNKKHAEDIMEQMDTIQTEQKQAGTFLADAKKAQSDAQAKDIATEMPADMAAYMDAHSLIYDTTGEDLLMTAEEWNTAIVSLESYLSEISSLLQQEMIYLQDFMGQYNSSTINTDTQTTTPNQTLSSLARGQSMYGDSEAGLAMTALLVGLVLGCVITLIVQKTYRKKGTI